MDCIVDFNRCNEDARSLRIHATYYLITCLQAARSDRRPVDLLPLRGVARVSSFKSDRFLFPGFPFSCLIGISSTMDEWQPIARTSNQIILYHAPSNALSVRTHQGDHVSITSIPGTPAIQSRATSSVNLPVLAARNASNGVVLGRRSSAVVKRNSPEVPPEGLCPYCYRPIPKDPATYPDSGPSASVSPLYTDDPTDSIIRPEWEQPEPQGTGLHHIKPYFQILEQSVDGSRASTPVQDPDDARRFTRESTTPGQQERRSVEGYYSRFFIEEKRLGMGAEGTVYLCQVSPDSLPSTSV